MDALVGWTANTDPDLAGYHVYHGVQSGVYYESFVVTAPTITRSFMGLDDYHTHYFAVSAYDTTGNESALSIEVSKTPASPVSPGPSNGRFLYLVSAAILVVLWAGGCN